MTFVIEKKGVGDTKAIDRDRDIVFTSVPLVDPDGLQNRFLLEWQSQKIYFDASKQKKDIQDKQGIWKLDLEWKVNAIMIPEGFPETRETVFQVICEALDVFGTYFNRDRINDIRIEHSKNAFETEIIFFSHKIWWDEEEEML